jgi:Transposase IS66 family
VGCDPAERAPSRPIVAEIRAAGVTSLHGIARALKTSHPIARGRAGPFLLAHILFCKYGLHLPLTRQSATYAREGVELDVSTLADWVGAASATLMPLVEGAVWTTMVIRWRHFYMGNRDGEEDNADSSVDKGRGPHAEDACAPADEDNHDRA